MKGFEYEDIGLFTFYRQQAQIQEKRQAQKRQKALRKKLKLDEQYKLKQMKQEQLKNKSINKYISQARITDVPPKDHLEQAKKYIKQLQESGHNKLIYSHRKRQKRYNNALESPQKEKLDVTGKLMDELSKNVGESEQIFINKKDYAKFNYYVLMDKQVIAPKQFNSVQIFQMKNDFGKRQLSQDLLKKNPSNQKKVFVPSQKKLPKISSQFSSRMVQSKSMPKKELKHLKVYYNPLDIILNNQKFQLKSMKKYQNKEDNQIQQPTNKQMESQQNSIFKIMRKYKLSK